MYLWIVLEGSRYIKLFKYLHKTSQLASNPVREKPTLSIQRLVYFSSKSCGMRTKKCRGATPCWKCVFMLPLKNRRRIVPKIPLVNLACHMLVFEDLDGLTPLLIWPTKPWQMTLCLAFHILHFSVPNPRSTSFGCSQIQIAKIHTQREILHVLENLDYHFTRFDNVSQIRSYPGSSKHWPLDALVDYTIRALILVFENPLFSYDEVFLE